MMRVISVPLTVAVSVLCLPAASRLAAQTGTIEGKVTSVTTGEPIIGAEVSLVGITIGTRTGPGGTFTLLNVPVGPREVRVLAIGYKVASAHLVVLPDLSTTTTVQLAPSVLQLDAIIVTGTPGQARVREVGNSIAQVNLSQVKDPPASMDQLLQARAPGLSVMQTSGMAGEGAQIQGITSPFHVITFDKSNINQVEITLNSLMAMGPMAIAQPNAKSDGGDTDDGSVVNVSWSDLKSRFNQ